MSKIIRGVSKNARFFVVDSKDVVQRALDIHKAGPEAIVAFGRLLTAGVMMGSTLKGEDLITLRTDTDGPLKHMIVSADSSGGVKGYMSNPMASVKGDGGKTNIGKLVGKGSLRVIKDLALKEPYVGISSVDSGEIGEDIAYYYYTSEQIPSVVSLGVVVDENMKVMSAGGYMIQLLPGADPKFIDKLEEKIKAIRPITELFLGGMDPERIVKLLYEDITDENHERLVEDYEVLDTKDIEYVCNCNKERFFKGLITLGKDEIKKIYEESEDLEVECHFCGTKYSFLEEEFFKK